MTMFSRSKAWALGLLITTFLAGLLAGAGTQRVLDARERRDGRRGPRIGYVERLSAELALSTGQQDTVRAIVERTRPAMDALWRTVRPTYDSLRTAMQAEIRGVLTPEQQARFGQLIEESERRERFRRSGNRTDTTDLSKHDTTH